MFVGKFEDFEEIFQFFFNFDKIVSGNPNMAEFMDSIFMYSFK
jgi:hypothetical protein